MLNWLKQKFAGTKGSWLRVQQAPGVSFPFPRGAKLRAAEELMLAFPASVIAADEKIGSVLLCDDAAEITLNDKVGAWYVKLKPGMKFSLARSCELMLIGADSRPRLLDYLAPDKEATGQGSAVAQRIH